VNLSAAHPSSLQEHAHRRKYKEQDPRFSQLATSALLPLLSPCALAVAAMGGWLHLR
jgi:hypothetical protein